MITSITIPEPIAVKYGLKQTTLRDLGKIVLLAGPNGAGKSRLLRAVQEQTPALQQPKVQIANLERQLASSSGFPPARPMLEAKLRALKASSPPVTSFVQTSSGRPITFAPFHYPAALGDVKAASGLPPSQVDQLTRGTQNVGLDHAYNGMDAYLSTVARRIWHANDERIRNSGSFQNEAADAERFNDILFALLGKRCEPDGSDRSYPLLGDRPFKPSELSTGERLLLTWAIALHQQGGKLDGLIALIDEPENHVHPDACIRALDRLAAVIGDHGQIWIATHSVPLVAWAGMESVYLVKGGEAIYARDRINEVMESLLGGPDGRERLQTMLADADAICASRFLAECLVIDPQPVQTASADPQKAPFQEALQAALKADRKLRVLDFGAGCGRLAAAVSDIEALHNRVEYFAFDQEGVSATHEAQCRSAIETLGDRPVAQRYWNSFAKLEAEVGAFFDVVILSNVLHELDPSLWPKVLREQIAPVLAESGVLLVLEDLVPRVGELPHAGGYIVLDESALKKLVGNANAVRSISTDQRGRLMTVAIPKASLVEVSSDTRRDALAYVRTHALERIDAIRASGDRTPKASREHAHFTMQFANAEIALSKLK